MPWNLRRLWRGRNGHGTPAPDTPAWQHLAPAARLLRPPQLTRDVAFVAELVTGRATPLSSPATQGLAELPVTVRQALSVATRVHASTGSTAAVETTLDRARSAATAAARDLAGATVGPSPAAPTSLRRQPSAPADPGPVRAVRETGVSASDRLSPPAPRERPSGRALVSDSAGVTAARVRAARGWDAVPVEHGVDLEGGAIDRAGDDPDRAPDDRVRPAGDDRSLGAGDVRSVPVGDARSVPVGDARHEASERPSLLRAPDKRPEQGASSFTTPVAGPEPARRRVSARNAPTAPAGDGPPDPSSSPAAGESLPPRPLEPAPTGEAPPGDPLGRPSGGSLRPRPLEPAPGRDAPLRDPVEPPYVGDASPRGPSQPVRPAPESVEPPAPRAPAGVPPRPQHEPDAASADPLASVVEAALALAPAGPLSAARSLGIQPPSTRRVRRSPPPRSLAPARLPTGLPVPGLAALAARQLPQLEPQPSAPADWSPSTLLGLPIPGLAALGRAQPRPGLPSRPPSGPGGSAPAVSQRHGDPPTPPGAADRAPPAGALSPPGTPPTPADLEELAQRVYDRVRGRLRAELLIDRERAGRLADLP